MDSREQLNDLQRELFVLQMDLNEVEKRIDEIKRRSRELYIDIDIDDKLNRKE